MSKLSHKLLAAAAMLVLSGSACAQAKELVIWHAYRAAVCD